jgi:hypothetical protein
LEQTITKDILRNELYTGQRPAVELLLQVEARSWKKLRLNISGYSANYFYMEGKKKNWRHSQERAWRI